MVVNLTDEERDILIDALQIYRDFLGEQSEEEEIEDHGNPDFSVLDNRAKTLILRLEVAHQHTEKAAPLRRTLGELAAEEESNET